MRAPGITRVGARGRGSRRCGSARRAVHRARRRTQQHALRCGAPERIPFADESFDVISSFNSLDHVDDLPAVVEELIRVLAPGGTLLLLMDVNHEPTDSEPLRLGWDVVTQFPLPLELMAQHHFEKAEGPRALYRSVWEPIPYDHDAGSDRPGVLLARFRKP